VVGQDLTTAIAILQAAGLEVEEGDVIEVPFGDENVDKVAEQDPAAGTELDVGDTVTLRIGISGDPVEVPNLIDFETDLGLVMEQGPPVEVEIGSPFDGNVSEQSPPPGTQVAPGDTVIVSLGQAPPGVEVPDVVTLDTDEAGARDRIEGRGLQYNHDETLDVTVGFNDPNVGKPVAMSPAAGEIVASNSVVDVGYYRREEATVPTVIDRTRQNAIDDIEGTNLNDGITNAGLVASEFPACAPTTPGITGVGWQSPAAGTIVQPGSTVEFRIADYGAAACPA
jgi:serine/threonine-protein kinase